MNPKFAPKVLLTIVGLLLCSSLQTLPAEGQAYEGTDQQTGLNTQQQVWEADSRLRELRAPSNANHADEYQPRRTMRASSPSWVQCSSTSGCAHERGQRRPVRLRHRQDRRKQMPVPMRQEMWQGTRSANIHRAMLLASSKISQQKGQQMEYLARHGLRSDRLAPDSAWSRSNPNEIIDFTGFACDCSINPFQRIQRSIVAVFLIPGTYLIVNYGIDFANSVQFTIASEYTRLFGSNMHKDAICAEIRAFGVRYMSENDGSLQTPPADLSSSSQGEFSAAEGPAVGKTG